jgi:hypothetical protein
VSHLGQVQHGFGYFRNHDPGWRAKADQLLHHILNVRTPPFGHKFSEGLGQIMFFQDFIHKLPIKHRPFAFQLVAFFQNASHEAGDFAFTSTGLIGDRNRWSGRPRLWHAKVLSLHFLRDPFPDAVGLRQMNNLFRRARCIHMPCALAYSNRPNFPLQPSLRFLHLP